MKMCDQILKKDRPSTIQILRIVKSKRRPIIAPDIAVRLLKNVARQVLTYNSKNFH